MTGILNVYKPQGMTSHAVVSKIRKIYNTKRVGHAGTLDPMACGVLPVLVGSAAAVQEIITGHDKKYRAGILFGRTTDTGDITGNTVSENTPEFSEKELCETLAKFIGEIEQIPPMYSALKKDGVKLYKLARNGIEVERKARIINIYSIELIKPLEDGRCEIEVSCSKGTYIRTLAEDIGKTLGCGACLYSLERTRCGAYTAENAVKLGLLEELYEKNYIKALEKLLESPEKLFLDKSAVKLPAFYERLALNGAEIYIKKAGIPEKLFEKDRLCRIYNEKNRFLAVGELLDFPDGKAVKIKYRLI
ncbi:MAG: tRNA pseudouridine(55) synthase TruB [Clostridia bacterium]|nr:tRNA pseudouridine(55) synthase TruB [Clostridia bacterium]